MGEVVNCEHWYFTIFYTFIWGGLCVGLETSNKEGSEKGSFPHTSTNCLPQPSCANRC